MADLLGAPVIKTLPGKAVIPDDSRFRRRRDRAARHPARRGAGRGLRHAVHDRDELPVHPAPARSRARCGSCRSRRTRSGPAVRMPTEVPVIGDAKESLQALMPMLTRKADRGHLEKYQKAMAKWRSDMDGLESPSARRSPRSTRSAVIDELAADDAVLTCDSGTIATVYPSWHPILHACEDVAGCRCHLDLSRLRQVAWNSQASPQVALRLLEDETSLTVNDESSLCCQGD